MGFFNPIQTTSAVTAINGKTGEITLSKSDVELSNVDNTSDLNKPISNAVQEALNNLDGGTWT